MLKMIASQTSHPSSLSFIRAPSGYYFCLIRCVFREEVMKSPLWTLLLLCLCSMGHSDCQGDCLTCRLILPEHQAFNTLVSALLLIEKYKLPINVHGFEMKCSASTYVCGVCNKTSNKSNMSIKLEWMREL